MKIAVFHTAVLRDDGRLMRFDILVPEASQSITQVLAFGRHYLQDRGQDGSALSTRECRFSHIETATPELARVLAQAGVAIIELENCD